MRGHSIISHKQVYPASRSLQGYGGEEIVNRKGMKMPPLEGAWHH